MMMMMMMTMMIMMQTHVHVAMDNADDFMNDKEDAAAGGIMMTIEEREPHRTKWKLDNSSKEKQRSPGER